MTEDPYPGATDDGWLLRQAIDRLALATLIRDDPRFTATRDALIRESAWRGLPELHDDEWARIRDEVGDDSRSCRVTRSGVAHEARQDDRSRTPA